MEVCILFGVLLIKCTSIFLLLEWISLGCVRVKGGM